MNNHIQAKQGDLKSAIEFFKKDISNLRTGRANPSIFDAVVVEAYGVKTPIAGLASITISDAKSLVVSPWDKNVLKDLEKAIVEASLGVGVVNEGDKIRVSIPLMTEENRKDLVKKLNEKQEKARIALKKVREEIKDSIEGALGKKEISEDERFKFVAELDEIVRDYNEEIKKIREEKEKDIMTI
ncbi:MAG: ribosome recycling factor [Patescibacteria group bacterium]|jgi:ribosome recycling factor